MNRQLVAVLADLAEEERERERSLLISKICEKSHVRGHRGCVVAEELAESTCDDDK